MLDDSTTDVSIDLPDMDSYWMPFTGNRYFKENQSENVLKELIAGCRMLEKNKCSLCLLVSRLLLHSCCNNFGEKNTINWKYISWKKSW